MPWDSIEVELSLRYEFLTTTDLAWAMELVRGPVREELLRITEYERFPRDFLEVDSVTTGSRLDMEIRPIPHVLSRYGVGPEEFEDAVDLGLRTAVQELKGWREGHNRSNVHGVVLRCGACGFDHEFEKEEQLKLEEFF